MKNRIIVYEKLNLFTFCLAIINRFFFGKQYFIDFNMYFKRFFYKIVKFIKLQQISDIDCLGKGFLPLRSKLILDFTEKIIKGNRCIASPLIEFGDDEKYLYVVKQTLNHSFFRQARIYLCVKLFSEKKEIQHYKTICFFPVSVNNIFKYKKSELPKLKIINYHYPLIKILDLFYRIFFNICFIAFPFYQFFLWIKRGQITIKKLTKERMKRNILFDHVRTELFVSNISRDMYLFRSNVIGISECIHVTSYGKFSKEKSSYLRENGGLVTDYQNYKVTYNYVIKRLIQDYCTFIIRHIFTISFNKYINYTFIKRYIGMIHYILEFENFIKQIDVKLIYFENELKDPFKVYSIIANKYGIKTMSMLHGFGPTMMPFYNRANALFNHYLVPGMSYRFYLKPNNPAVEKFHLVGNHEIDNNIPQSVNQILLKKIRNLKKKYIIIGVLASYYYPFLPEFQSHPLFYEDTWEIFKQYWMPFFMWAGREKNIFLIFKGKGSREYKQYEHPYLIKALDLIQDERYIQDDSLNIKDVISVSDVIISTGNSSTNFASLCMEVPNISLDVLSRGYNLKRYSKYIVAETGEELIHNLKYVLENGLPKRVFDSFKRDHYGMNGNVDGKTHVRIKKLIGTIIKGETT